MGRQSLGLNKNLVLGLVGKAGDLVFDRRAIAWPYPFDHPGIHGRSVHTTANDLVGFFIGVSDVTRDLIWVIALFTNERHDRCWCVTGLRLNHIKINGSGIQSWRSTGLESVDPQRQLPQAIGQCNGRCIPCPAATEIFQSNMNSATKECADSQYHGFGFDLQSHLGDHTGDLIIFDNQVFTGLLEQFEVGLVFQSFADRRFVELAIGLGAGSSNSRSFGRIEGAKLDAGFVCGQCHGTTQGIDFFYQMAFANTADSRITRHLAQRINVLGQQQSMAAHSCSCQCSFGSGVAAADHDHIKCLVKIHAYLKVVLSGSTR